jgi:hypothetical protein
VIATLLWLVASGLFSWYVSNSGSYNETYGSLAAIVILLMWLYLSAFVVLFGAELNSEMERQTARDTTTGEPVPMGQREAAVADTVARGEKGQRTPATAPPRRKGRTPRGPEERAPEPAQARGEVGMLEREIEDTRRRIDATARALNERLRRERLAESTRASLRKARGAERGGVRERPLLLGTLGAATGALLGASLARRPDRSPPP